MSSRYSKWPWPTVLPFAKEKWFTSLSTNESVSQSVRGVQTTGDAAVAFLLGVVTYRAYSAYSEGKFKTLRFHTTGMPPALIAQDFSFENPETNRKVTSRGELDKFRQQVGERKLPLEEFIFKY